MRYWRLASARTRWRPRKPEPPNTVTSVSDLVFTAIAGRNTGTIWRCIEGYAARLTPRRLLRTYPGIAQVAELVDALVSGTSAARRGGSSPLLGTTRKKISFDLF